MATIGSILIFGPAGNNASTEYLYVYINSLYPMAREFEKRGIRAHVCLRPLDGEDLKAVVDRLRPDCVFDINRSRHQMAGLPADLPHISWVQDHRTVQNKLVSEGFGGSDITYFFLEPAYFGFAADDPVNKTFKFLHPGADETVFRPGADAKVSDVAFIGYIAPKTSDKVLETPLGDGQKSFRLGELVDALVAAGIGTSNTGQNELKAFLQEFARARLDNPAISADDFDEALLGLLMDDILRWTERVPIVEELLRIGSSVRLFGSYHWLTWPQFQAHYCGGPLTFPHQLARVYRTSTLAFHNGILTMHFRVMEAMACGIPVLVKATPFADKPGGIRNFLEPGRDYIEFDTDTLEERARTLLADEDLRREIGENAARAIRSGHTWGHRVEQILDDLGKL